MLSNIKMIIVALVMSAMAIATYTATNKADSLAVELVSVQNDYEQVSAEAARLANDLDVADFTLSRVLAERESIAAIRAQADAEAERLRNELADAEQQVVQLRVSHDEYVKKYANATMPANAVRLLKYADAGNSQDSYSDEGSLQVATSGSVALLHPNHAF